MTDPESPFSIAYIAYEKVCEYPYRIAVARAGVKGYGVGDPLRLVCIRGRRWLAWSTSDVDAYYQQAVQEKNVGLPAQQKGGLHVKLLVSVGRQLVQ